MGATRRAVARAVPRSGGLSVHLKASEGATAPGRILAQGSVQGPCLRGYAHSSLDQNLFGGHFAPIEVLIPRLILLKHHSIKRRPGKQTSRARVTEDFGVKLRIGGAFRRTPHRSGCCGQVST